MNRTKQPPKKRTVKEKKSEEPVKKVKRTKRIIHLSDLHIGYRDCGERFGHIIDNIIYLKQPASDYVVIITGDLIESAFNPSSYNISKIHINRLVEANYQVVIVPGNHDYGDGFHSEKIYRQKFKDVYYGKNTSYPRKVYIDKGNKDTSIAILVLDSMDAEMDAAHDIGSAGKLGRNQLKRLDRFLKSDEVKECKYRVVCLHHHPEDKSFLMKLKDSDELRNVLDENKTVSPINAILFGHLHDGEILNRGNGLWGIPRFYNAGSSTYKNDEKGIHFVMDLSKSPREDYDGKFLDDYAF